MIRQVISSLAAQIVLAFVGLVLIAIFLPVLGPTSSQAACDMRWYADPNSACGQATQQPHEGATDVSLTPSFHWDYGGYRPEDNGQCVQPSGCGTYSARVYLAEGSSYSPNSIIGTCGLGTQGSPVKDAPFSCFNIAALKPNTAYSWVVTPFFDGVVHAEQGWTSHFRTASLVVNNIPNCTSLTTGADLNNLQVGTEYSFQLTAGGTAPVTDVEMSVYGSGGCSNNLKGYAPQSVSGPGTYTIKWTPTQVGSFTAYGRVWNDGIAECRSDCVDGPPRFLCSGAAACKLAGNVKTTPANHFECQNNACVVVQGPGQNSCNLDADCVPVTHKECQNNACVVVSGIGQSVCNVDSDCVPVTHKECRNNACAVVTGTGQNSCNIDNDCVPQTHRECRSSACVVVSGSGSNQCNVDGDCVSVSHNECRNNSCVSVSGPGASSCSSNSDCVPPTQSVVCDSLTVSPQSGNSPLTVTAVLSGHTVNGGSIVNYRFNFGDATGDRVQSGQTLSHTYQNTGNFLVNGYVIDNLGNQTGATVACQKVVTVNQPQVLGVATPPAIPKTGPETGILFGLLGSGIAGWVLKKWRV